MGLEFLKNSTVVLIAAVLMGLLVPGPAKAAYPLITPALMIMMMFSMSGIEFLADRSGFVPTSSRSTPASTSLTQTHSTQPHTTSTQSAQPHSTQLQSAQLTSTQPQSTQLQSAETISSSGSSSSSGSRAGLFRSALSGTLMNYCILSGLILLLSSSLPDGPLKRGFVVMAAVPPAIAIMPMTRILRGDSRLSFLSEALSYLLSLLLMPAIIFAFTSNTGLSVSRLLEISTAFILIPALASRAVTRVPLDPLIPINLGFFLVTYIVIGCNQVDLWNTTAIVAEISIARTFIIGLLIMGAALATGVGDERAISYGLLGSFKNLGLAATVSILLFGQQAAIPAAFSVLAETGFFILLTIIRPRQT